MRKLMTMMTAMLMVLASCAQNKKESDQTEGASKTLVAYFSATGTTKKVAEMIAKEHDADLLEIQPETAYTEADLNWKDQQSRSTMEMADENSRPAIKEPALDAAAYDTIYIGFPVWWNVAPRVVNTYLERYDLTGKTLIPFVTSGSSSIDNSEAQLRRQYPKANWVKGKRYEAVE